MIAHSIFSDSVNFIINTDSFKLAHLLCDALSMGHNQGNLYIIVRGIEKLN